MIHEYMIPVYAFLVLYQRRALESIPEAYQEPVRDYLNLKE